MSSAPHSSSAASDGGGRKSANSLVPKCDAVSDFAASCVRKQKKPKLNPPSRGPSPFRSSPAKWAQLQRPLLVSVFDFLLSEDCFLSGEEIISCVRHLQMVCKQWSAALSDLMGEEGSWKWLHKRLFAFSGDRSGFIERMAKRREALGKVREAEREWEALDYFGRPSTPETIESAQECFDKAARALCGTTWVYTIDKVSLIIMSGVENRDVAWSALCEFLPLDGHERPLFGPVEEGMTHVRLKNMSETGKTSPFITVPISLPRTESVAWTFDWTVKLEELRLARAHASLSSSDGFKKVVNYVRFDGYLLGEDDNVLRDVVPCQLFAIALCVDGKRFFKFPGLDSLTQDIMILFDRRLDQLQGGPQVYVRGSFDGAGGFC